MCVTEAWNAGALNASLQISSSQLRRDTSQHWNSPLIVAKYEEVFKSLE